MYTLVNVQRVRHVHSGESAVETCALVHAQTVRHVDYTRMNVQ